MDDELLMKKIFDEIENKIETNEEIKERETREKLCQEIRNRELNTLDDIENAKNCSRNIPFSLEKVLLFKYLITIENQIKLK